MYTGETSRHLSTRVCEYLFNDKNSIIFKHLKDSDFRKEAWDSSSSSSQSV